MRHALVSLALLDEWREIAGGVEEETHLFVMNRQHSAVMRGETTEQWRSERWSHRKMRCDWWLESHGEESEGQSVEPHISF